jgi:hypothetical protein
MGLIGDVPTAQTLSCWFQQGGGPCAGQVAMAAKDGISGCSCSDAGAGDMILDCAPESESSSGEQAYEIKRREPTML